MARTILATEDFLEVTPEVLADSARTVYVYDVTPSVGPFVSDVADFASNGTGTTRVLGKHRHRWSGLGISALFVPGSIL